MDETRNMDWRIEIYQDAKIPSGMLTRWYVLISLKGFAPQPIGPFDSYWTAMAQACKQFAILEREFH